MTNQRTLASMLELDPERGLLFYKPRPRSDFTADQHYKSWNTQHAGKQAFTSKHSAGYLSGKSKGVSLLAHRVVWIIANGDIPPGYEVDHINGDRSDNRLSNLRLVAPGENQKNAARSARNRSGHIGVGWQAQLSKWHARIKVNRKSINLGYFDAIDDAIKARKAAEKRFGFHPNHGRPLARGVNG